MAKVIIAGGREFNQYPLLKLKCDKILQTLDDITIISGTCRGADLLGERYAKEKGYPIVRYPADWDKHKKAAGYIRNEEMAKVGTHLIVFWDKRSKGTEHMINLAKDYGLEIRIIFY